MKNLKKVVFRNLPVLSTAIVAGVAASPAWALSFAVSGQVDRAVTAADNGNQSDIGFVDNAGNNTRFRFTGDQKVDDGMTLGFVYEIGLGVNPSSTFDVDNGGGSNNTYLDDRLANVYLSGDFGEVSLGKVNGAANDTSELNYSGNEYLGGGIDVRDYSAGLSFLDKNGQTITQLGSAIDQFDALSRQNAIRYDTPSIHGAVLSASLDNGHAFEFAGRYEVPIGKGGKFGIRTDYVDSQDIGRVRQPDGLVVSSGKRFQEYGGSSSLLLPSGLNFTVSYKHRHYISNAVPNAQNAWGGIGYIYGRNHFELSYGQTDDYLNAGSEGGAYGASYVFDWLPSVDLFGSYHLYQLDHANDPAEGGRPVDAKDINQLYAGVRVKFL